LDAEAAEHGLSKEIDRRGGIIMSIIYERVDKGNVMSKWVSGDGQWKGSNWQDVHTQLKQWGLSIGASTFTDTPVTPWSRIFWLNGQYDLRTAITPAVVTLDPDAPTPKPGPDPEPSES
jgi:hypothetical protein